MIAKISAMKIRQMTIHRIIFLLNSWLSNRKLTFYTECTIRQITKPIQGLLYYLPNANLNQPYGPNPAGIIIGGSGYVRYTF